MTLLWTEDVTKILNAAQSDADKMHVKFSTMLILRRILRTDCSARNILSSLGVTYESFMYILNSTKLTPEHPTTPRVIFERASRHATFSTATQIEMNHLLLAILDEDCLARTILQALNIDFERLRSILYGYDSTAVQYRTATHASMSFARSGSVTTMHPVMVQHSGTITKVPEYIEPVPAATYGNDSDIVSEETDILQSFTPRAEDVCSRRRLMTANEIAMLTAEARIPEPDVPSSRESYYRTPNASTTPHSPIPSAPSIPAIREGFSSGSLKSVKRQPSLRESQQATALDLARRLRTKSLQMAAALAQSSESTDEETASSKAISKDDVSLISTSQDMSTDAPVASEDHEAIQALSPKSDAELPSVECANDKASSCTPSSPFLSPVSPSAKRVVPGHAQILTRKTFRESTKSVSSSNQAVSISARAVQPLPPGYNPFALHPTKFPVLSQFGRNLLQEARNGKIDPVIGRDHEMDQLIDILHKRRSNNPVLVGEAGVGKTAIIEGLAYRMAQNDAPRGLENHTIIALDYGAILCGTQLRGAVQERINAIKKEIRQSNGLIILFLDEIHTWLAPANGDANSDAAVELKLALSRGELMCIGASTPAELRRAFNADPAFERRFDVIEVKAPSVKTSIQIIKTGIIHQYEAHHGIHYSEEAITSAVRLSDRYIQDRALPDKALSVLDRAGSLCVRSGDDVVTLTHIAKVISLLTEVPVERLCLTEKQKLMNMEQILSERLIGHETNIARMAQVIRRNQAGFGAHRPIGSFLFLGPTGVGKTEAAKVLAEFLFGNRKNIVRFDMSEFMEQHSVAKLIGAPAGYVGFDDGGLLTEALRKHPYQIVLFDEIEKAHPDVMNILLQILDEGRLTDAKGRHADFSNAVIILTSNIGAQELMDAARKSIGFSGNPGNMSETDAERIMLKAAQARFTPELYNRIEEKLVFHALTRPQIEQIASLLLNDSRKRLLEDKHIDLHIHEDNLIPYLIEQGGFDPMYGARPMRQKIQSLVESRIAEWILSHDTLPEALDVDLIDDIVTVTQAESYSWSDVNPL